MKPREAGGLRKGDSHIPCLVPRVSCLAHHAPESFR